MKLSYEITFVDGKKFKGNSLDGSWKNVPNKPIKELLYFFGTKKLLLKGYKQYNHLVEKVNVLGKKVAVSQILLIGRKEKESDLLIIDFTNKRIFKEVVEIGEEYQVPVTTGWRNGIS